MKLQYLRKSRGLSQKALGEMIGMDAATINRAEKMHMSAKLSTYVLCAKALNVTLAEIFSDDRTEAQNQLLRAFDRLPEARQRAWLEMARLAAIEADQADGETAGR